MGRKKDSLGEDTFHEKSFKPNIIGKALVNTCMLIKGEELYLTDKKNVINFSQ